MKWIAALFWLCFAAAQWAHAHGNPTAINGVVGAGLVAAICTGLAWIERGT